MKIEIFSRVGWFRTQWYFRIRAKNGEPVAQSEGYHNRGDCVGMAHTLKRELGKAEIVSD